MMSRSLKLRKYDVWLRMTTKYIQKDSEKTEIFFSKWIDFLLIKWQIENMKWSIMFNIYSRKIWKNEWIFPQKHRRRNLIIMMYVMMYLRRRQLADFLSFWCDNDDWYYQWRLLLIVLIICASYKWFKNKKWWMDVCIYGCMYPLFL